MPQISVARHVECLRQLSSSHVLPPTVLPSRLDSGVHQASTHGLNANQWIRHTECGYGAALFLIGAPLSRIIYRAHHSLRKMPGDSGQTRCPSALAF